MLWKAFLIVLCVVQAALLVSSVSSDSTSTRVLVGLVALLLVLGAVAISRLPEKFDPIAKDAPGQAFPEGGTIAVGVWLIYLAGGAVFGLVQVLSPEPSLVLYQCPQPAKDGVDPCAELTMLATATFAGALGSVIYAAERFIEHIVKKGDFSRAYAGWYVARPLQGTLLAVVFYLLLRGGIVTLGLAAKTPDLNRLGLAAMCALVGLFSNDAMQRMRLTFKTMFSTQADLVARLEELKTLKEKKLITDADFEAGKKAIVASIVT